MPAGKCRNCGRITNSATSNWIQENGGPTKCWLRVNRDKNWEKGCGWDAMNDEQILFYEPYLGKPAFPKDNNLRNKA
jgi:hypothetical protein